MADARPGVVSVVIVNYKGVEDTLACLAGFAEVDWPADRLELVVVDNASDDGSVERLRAEAPHVRLVAAETNLGFAGGCNAGVAAATGEYVGFLNNDARPHRGWIRAAADVLDNQPAVAAVASKVLDWEGKTIDYVDGSMSWFGAGFKRQVLREDTGEYDVAKDVLYGTGAAMFVRTEVFRSVGGFDERFFMFFEDVDLGWRLNLLGHRFRFVPESLAYHRHHRSMRSYGEWRERYLIERNSLMMIYKNYGDDALARVLPAAMALTVRRGISRGGDDPRALDLARGTGGEDAPSMLASKQTLAATYALDAFLEELPGLRADREDLQKHRKRSDAQLFALFREPFEPAYGEKRFLEGHTAVVESFGIPALLSGRRRVAIVTADTLGERMAGPAIRAFEIARSLSVEHDVQLVTISQSTLTHPDFSVRAVGDRELKQVHAWCDVLLFQGFIMNSHPWLEHSDKVLVVDIYDPFHLELLEQAKDLDEGGRRHIVGESIKALNTQLTRGDFFLCASHKQRDFWLGQLAGLGRINPDTYDDDESLDSLISIVPFGVTDSPPVKTAQVIKGVHPGIGPDDKVVLWGGGIYNWFDPLTLIRAIDRLRVDVPNVRLFFLGLKHPNPAVPEMRMAVAARTLADRLGITDTHVFFNEGWVPYDERQNYLLEADCGVSTHLPHVETAFSYRTRILDYLWCSLPMVATDGDTFAPIIRENGLGLTVPPQDVDALADALRTVLVDDEFAGTCRENVRRYVPTHTWSQVLLPLAEFCRAPRRSADSASLPTVRTTIASSGSSSVRPFLPDDSRTLGTSIRLAREYHQQGGTHEVARRVMGRVRKKARQALGG